MVTRARKVPGGYALTGAKPWISNAPIADVFLVWAKTEDGIIRGFLLDKATGSERPGDPRQGRATRLDHGEVVMENAFTPEENLLP